MHNRRLWLGVCAMLLLVACSGMGSSARQGCAKVGAKAGIGGPSTAVKQAIFASWHFRDISTEHYVRALQEYADKKVRAKFAALDRQIWPTVEPKLGWALLLEPAIVCVGKPRDGAVPIGVYSSGSNQCCISIGRATRAKSGQR